MGQLDCPSCFHFSGTNIGDYLRHIRLFHNDTGTTFRVFCNLGCARPRDRPFKNFFTFRNHVYAYHSGLTATAEQNENETNAIGDSEPDQSVTTEEIEIDQGFTCQQTVRKPQNIDYSAQIQKCAATFILKIQEMHRLPQNTMDTIIQEIESLYQVIDYTISKSMILICFNNYR